MTHTRCHVSLIALAAALWTAEARAQACAPAAPADGDTVTCAATGDGIRDGGLDNATITVTPTGDVQGGANTAFEVDDDLTLTNAGAITSTGDRGIDADKDADITNTGTITARNEAIKVDDDATVTNDGTITSTDNRAIEGEDGLTVVNSATGVIDAATADAINSANGLTATNHGTIHSGDDAVQADDDATVTNTGTITADDKGITVGNNATVTNSGTLTVADEGIETGDDATVENSGTITAADDAIQVGENAQIVNSGQLVVTGDQDGIDLDSGTVENSGSIVTQGNEAGIDFDAGTNAATILNTGHVEGEAGIETDPANTQTQDVTNSGTITGRGGRAINLGEGDDSLTLQGKGRITGTVEMGPGTDTLTVLGMAPGTLVFDTAPEVVDMANAPAQALFAGLTLVMADPLVFGAADVLSARLGHAMGSAALRQPRGDGWWIAGNARAAEDDASEGTLAAGRDFGAWGLFAMHSRGRADLDDDLHEVDQHGTAIGLRAGWALGHATRLSGALFAGYGETDIDSPGFVTGSSTADGDFQGFTLRLSHDPATAEGAGSGPAFSAQAGVTRFGHDSFAVSGLGGARFDSRDVTTSFVALEAALPLATGGALALRPFIGAYALFADGDAVTMRLPGGSTRFATGGDDDVAALRLGTELRPAGGTTPWHARIEVQIEDGGDAALGLGASAGF